jgi:hypothetical protein
MNALQHKSSALKRVGLAVVFASLGEPECQAVELAWQSACRKARNWQPAFIEYGVEPLKASPDDVDILVYLGESSRFDTVAGELTQRVPVVLVKSTIEELMSVPAGYARRYRMSTGVDGIGSALAQVAPLAPSVDWTSLPWPDDVRSLLHLDEAEGGYVQKSIEAFRHTAARRGIPWQSGLPADGQPFSVFLTMHDPTAAKLAETALELWPQCTVLTADGMVSTSAPSGRPWPERMLRVRHWSPAAASMANRIFREELDSADLPDFDSPGMTFGTLVFLDHALGTGAPPAALEQAGDQPGPLGAMRMLPTGKCYPERLIVFRGVERMVMEIG